MTLINLKNELNILFVEIDHHYNYGTFMNRSIDYLNKVFPIGDNKIKWRVLNNHINTDTFFSNLNLSDYKTNSTSAEYGIFELLMEKLYD